VRTGPIDALEQVFRLEDLGDGQFAMIDDGRFNLYEPYYLFADFFQNGLLRADPAHVGAGTWWMFTIEATAAPADPDPQQYLDANPDLVETLGTDHDAALDHWRSVGWAEGRPVTQ